MQSQEQSNDIHSCHSNDIHAKKLHQQLLVGFFSCSTHKKSHCIADDIILGPTQVLFPPGL